MVSGGSRWVEACGPVVRGGVGWCAAGYVRVD